MTIDVNTASRETLIAVKGLHVALADAIIRARPFDSIDHLTSVSGIGRRSLQALKQQGLIVRSLQPPKDTLVEQPEPYFVQATAECDPYAELKLGRGRNPLPLGTLGDMGLAARVVGPAEFPETILIQPFGLHRLTGIDSTSVRVFRWDRRFRLLRPVWCSGINLAYGFIWTIIRQPGVYVPIGLPRDRLLQQALRTMARQRRYAHTDSPEEMRAITKDALELFTESPEEDLEELRQLLALVEVQTGLGPFSENELRIGGGGNLMPFPLAREATLEQFRERLARLETPPGGLPEEALFYTPDPEDPIPPWPLPPSPRPPEPEPRPWPFPPRPEPWPGIDPRVLERLRLRDLIVDFSRFPICWILARDWWTFHHDEALTGNASGCSAIRRCNVCTMGLRHTIALNGPVISIPSIVAGKVYVGTGNSTLAASSSGGTLYRIDLASGTVENKFTFDTPPGSGSRQGYAGIGCSPAIVGGKVYFSGLDGKVYCLDANTLTSLWVTDLRNTDLAHNQPVNHGSARSEGWSSPLVVNGKVYVGFGEGESNAFGFVYCLDANTGSVIWLFCTNQFSTAADNAPNVIPPSAYSGTPPSPFSKAPADPPQRGASPWSSCSYDRTLNRIYVGTGNAVPDDPLPDPKYASGVLALDANTGAFQGFYQPPPASSYKPTDDDVDVPAGPMLFTRGGTRVVAFGSKNGSFFLLDANTMAELGRRQLLPYDSAGNPFPNIDPGAGENRFGVFGTAAVHHGLGRLFVGVGGYSCGIDSTTTPFMRALNWTNTLDDAWAMSGTNPAKYTVPVPPMYTTSCEAGISSPAVVNDVVFMSTSKPGLYAFDAATGLCLWAAPGLGAGNYAVGPAIYGSFVAIGVADKLYIYSL